MNLGVGRGWGHWSHSYPEMLRSHCTGQWTPAYSTCCLLLLIASSWPAWTSQASCDFKSSVALDIVTRRLSWVVEVQDLGKVGVSVDSSL